VSESIESLVERVREGLVTGWSWAPQAEVPEDVLAALDSLTAALERAERQAQERLEEVMRVSGEAAGLEARAQKAEVLAARLTEEAEWGADVLEEAKDAVARAQKAERERDENLTVAVRFAERAQKAEAVVEAAKRSVDTHPNLRDHALGRALDALREIDTYGTHFTPQTRIARNALAAIDEPPTGQATDPSAGWKPPPEC
jgi:ribosome-associated translation inhibitor RaiA